MPPSLPDRYRLNVRLGRDGDIEEWLATDDQLDRPVLVRYLVPEASPERREAFLGAVRAAAAANHPHLQRVYAAGSSGGAYSVSEWDGAVSVADRLRSSETVPVDEFLPNAGGLAEGLAVFHALGGVHGSIDESTIHYSAAHPAKLGGWGRIPHRSSQSEDTIDLANALRTAITGSASPSIKPSHVADGLPAEVDLALDAASAGSLTATQLADALRAAPYRRPRQETGTASFRWRWSLAFAGIVASILVVAAIGLAVDVDPDSPFLFPGVAPDRPSPSTTAPPVVDDAPDDSRLSAGAQVFDPLGDGVENDDQLPNLSDGDVTTAWTTEPYSQPLPQIKAGVGITFSVLGNPSGVVVSGTAGARFRWGWSPTPSEALGDFEDVASGTLLGAPTRIQLPDRNGGVWLFWLTDLPEAADGSFQVAIDEVRFLP